MLSENYRINKFQFKRRRREEKTFQIVSLMTDHSERWETDF